MNKFSPQRHRGTEKFRYTAMPDQVIARRTAPWRSRSKKSPLESAASVKANLSMAKVKQSSQNYKGGCGGFTMHANGMRMA